MTTRIFGLTAAAAALLYVPGVLAHHSFAAVFDAESPVEVTGTVQEIEWLNPHVWFYIDVETEDGSIENWSFEMGSPNRLMRSGWNERSMKSGDVVTVTASRARDGSRKASVLTVTLSTGERLFGAQDTSR